MVAHAQVLPSERSSYTILGETSAVSFAPKLWILFIPFGGSSDQGLYDRAYKKSLREFKGANGLMSEQIEYKKVKLPLLVVTFVYKQVKVTGVAYHIKNDVDRKNDLQIKSLNTLVDNKLSKVLENLFEDEGVILLIQRKN